VTAHPPQVGVLSVTTPYLAENRQNPRRNSSGVGAGVLLSGASQLAARRPAGTLDNNFTLLAHKDVLCA
jgi:hypothetical protein